MNVSKFRFWAFLIALVAIVAVGTVGFMATEGFSAADSFYFSVVTITTVGFGDFHPTTGGGKVLAVMMILVGVGTFTGLVATTAEMLLSKRERQNRLEKLNMVIGAFFSELGTELLAYFSDHDPLLEEIRQELIVTGNWTSDQFREVSMRLKKREFTVEMEKINLPHLHSMLRGRRDFMLRLVENPTLLEHEEFTDLLMGAFHLTEELASRESLEGLPSSDLQHLAGDVKRTYALLVHQWLDYLCYLKKNYPYLFSHAMRTNPFDLHATPIVT